MVEWRRRQQDEEAPNYTDPDLFSLEINNKGNFGKWSYYNGEIDWFDYCDVDQLSIIEVKAMMLELGVEDDVEFFWLQPGSDFNNGLKTLQSGPDIVKMCESVLDNRLIKIFVKHLNENDAMRGILEMERELVDKVNGINDEIGGKYSKKVGVLSDASDDSNSDGSEDSDYNYDGPDDFEFGSDDDDLDSSYEDEEGLIDDVSKFQKVQALKMKNTKVGIADEGGTSQKVQDETATSNFNKRGSKRQIERPKGSRANRSMEFGSKFRPRGIDDKEYEMLDETGWGSEEDEADTVNY